MKTLRNTTKVAKVVKILGGLEGIARLTGANRTTVWNWIEYFEAFPPRYYVLMTQELERYGYTASPDLWGMQKRKRAA